MIAGLTGTVTNPIEAAQQARRQMQPTSDQANPGNPVNIPTNQPFNPLTDPSAPKPTYAPLANLAGLQGQSNADTAQQAWQQFGGSLQQQNSCQYNQQFPDWGNSANGNPFALMNLAGQFQQQWGYNPTSGGSGGSGTSYGKPAAVGGGTMLGSR